MKSDRNRKAWKLTARGEMVALIAEGLILTATAWSVFWLLWAGLNVLVGN